MPGPSLLCKCAMRSRRRLRDVAGRAAWSVALCWALFAQFAAASSDIRLGASGQGRVPQRTAVPTYQLGSLPVAPHLQPTLHKPSAWHHQHVSSSQHSSAWTFPWVKCNPDPSAAHLTLTPAATSQLPGGLMQHCFQVVNSSSATSTNTTSRPCASMDLFKLEVEANRACFGALAYAEVDGVKQPPVFITRPKPLIRVNVRKAAKQAAGTQVCLVLQPPCTTWSLLSPGGSYTASLLSDPAAGPYRCCPTFTGSHTAQL